MHRNAQAQVERMSFQLTPADLGRLEVKMKFSKEGAMKAHLSAERPETLAMLQKDSSHLEKILQKSGLNIDENSLTFDLQQHNPNQDLESFAGHRKNNRDEFANPTHGNAPEHAIQARIALHANGYVTQSGVNIMV